MLKKLMHLFQKKQPASLPLLIIKKGASADDIKEFTSIEEALASLEDDPDIPAEKIERLRSSLNDLKNKRSIRIRNGEIIR